MSTVRPAGGNGIPGGAGMICPECNGDGVVITEVMALPFWEEREVECDECRGTGEADDEHC